MPLISQLPPTVIKESGPIRIGRSTPAATKLERRFGLPAAVAKLVAELAGLGVQSSEAR